MLRRLEYLLFVACVILAAIFAPRFMFAIQDRANNQTVYAEYKEMNISSVLVSNYIEDDAERYTTYLYRKSLGAEFEAMELEGSLNNGEILELLQEALGMDDYYYDAGYGYGFEMFSGNVLTLESTQYAIYDSQDHSDIMFLVTLISIYLDSGHDKLSDDGNLTHHEGIKVLVDSQTGALYFIGFYYYYNPFEDFNLFSGSAYDAVKAYERIMYDDQVPNMSSHTYAEMMVLPLTSYVMDDWKVEDVYHVELEDDTKYTEVDSIGDFDWESGFLTTVETINMDEGDYTTFRINFAVKSPEDVPTAQESSYVTVTTLTQFNTYEAGEYFRYEANLCIGLENFADLIPEFNFMHSYG
ncbi:MAG: hypothetical protein LUC90_11700 [Lachnospiraceae bacterium]|nr:hypothetical protein [Lachnospiraceae bacterium]